ncbi:MAG: type II toxin-antitoxin system prevent-host-death family antitoxin [Deltaproteobacteria bacterium]|nr:type II toxin-antitoxin system prevent-host-death family antitoxin [Deltaproteobacteria bacterium]
MRTEKLSDAKNQLSRLVERVRRGERVRILSRGIPVADLVPVQDPPAAGGDLDRRLADLERKGIIRRAARAIDRELLEPGPRAAGRPLSELLIEERRSGR